MDYKQLSTSLKHVICSLCRVKSLFFIEERIWNYWQILHMHIYIYFMHTHSTYTRPAFLGAVGNFNVSPHTDSYPRPSITAAIKGKAWDSERSMKQEYLGQSSQPGTELPDYYSWCKTKEIWKSRIERRKEEYSQSSIRCGHRPYIRTQISLK